jgi:hypothetical protein
MTAQSDPRYGRPQPTWYQRLCVSYAVLTWAYVAAVLCGAK